MKVSRNALCPCGSKMKYKKCCLAQDEKTAAEERRKSAEAEERRRLAEAARHDTFVQYAMELEELSNRANDLRHAKRWPEAEACCRELLERFPDEIDGHWRSYECFKDKGDLYNARIHALATLERVESGGGFDPSFPARLKKDIARFKDAVPAEGSRS